MLVEIASKSVILMKKVIDRGKVVKPVENISKNLQNFIEISPVQIEVLPSHKLQDHAYEE